MANVADQTLAGDPAAHDLMRVAHDRSYRYPTDFGGFEAKLTYTGPEGDATGTVKVTSARSVEVTILAEETGRGWLRRELGSMVGHRWHMPYEEADGAHELALGDDDDNPLGVTIDVIQDSYDSSYRVLEQEISQVNRAMGRIRFSIQIQSRDEAPDGRSLPSNFTVFYWDTENERLSRSDVYHDVYEPVGGVPLPISRQIISADDAGITTRRMALSEHRLLEPSENGESGQLEYREG